MNWWRTLPNQQRTLVAGGIGVVVVLAVVTVLRRGSAPAAPADPELPTAPADGTLPAYVSTDAIGTGELAQFQDTISAALWALQEEISNGETGKPSTPAPVPAGTKTHTTATGQTLMGIAKYVYTRYYGPRDVRSWGWAHVRNANPVLAARYGQDKVLPAGVRVVLTPPKGGW